MFHLTRRRQNPAFFLKFACNRNAYRYKLREHLLEHQLWLLDYCLTCNHVHLLVDAQERGEISRYSRRTTASDCAHAAYSEIKLLNALMALFWGP